MDFFKVIFITYIGIFTFYINGYLLTRKLSTHNLFNHVSITCIMGTIVISFVSLFINFFYPLNKIIGNLFILISLIFFIKLFFFEKKKFKFFFILSIISLISVILISYENINRPDAGLYHLPYIQILQENKILIGLTNLHFRFGHTSIIQYLSAIYNNSLMPIEAISMPLALLVSSFFIYLMTYFDSKYENKVKILIFFISIYVFYSFNRYSNFGNDATAHLFFFILIIKLFEIDFKKIRIDELGSLTLISTFIFFQKSSMVFVLMIPCAIYLIFFTKNLSLFRNYKILFSILFILVWTLKNILISGCIVYPIWKSCFNNLGYTDLKEVQFVELNSEAYSKDWSNNKTKLRDMSTYSKNFNWVSTWENNHFKYIKKKIIPYLIFIFLFTIICKIFYSNKHNRKNINYKKISLILFFNLFLTFIWFIKFPIYRYGQSFIILNFIIIFYLFFLKYINYKNLSKIFNIFLLFIILGISFKNMYRIHEKKKYKNIWPNIYTLSEKKEHNFKKNIKKVFNENKFIYYFSENGECLYNKSPCSNFYKTDIKKKEKNGYTIFYQ